MIKIENLKLSKENKEILKDYKIELTAIKLKKEDTTVESYIEDIYKYLEYIEKNKGILFDEKIVEVFMEIISKYPVGTILDTDNNEKCVVIKQTNYIDNPLVRIIDNDGNIIGDNKFFKYLK